jgi:hypothetical protein
MAVIDITGRLGGTRYGEPVRLDLGRCYIDLGTETAGGETTVRLGSATAPRMWASAQRRPGGSHRSWPGWLADRAPDGRPRWLRLAGAHPCRGPGTAGGHFAQVFASYSGVVLQSAQP